MQLAWNVVKTALIIVAGLIALRWAWTEYWVATHCTVVLGTRTCR